MVFFLLLGKRRKIERDRKRYMQVLLEQMPDGIVSFITGVSQRPHRVELVSRVRS